MLIVIFGESCVGKSALAEKLKDRMNAELLTGKDYLRLAKSESMARLAFKKKMSAAIQGEDLIWVVAEKTELALAPEGAVRVLVTAELDVILERFAARMGGTLPKPVEDMLRRKYGCFDGERHDVCVRGDEGGLEAVRAAIMRRRAN